ncbi:YqeG family HAD IIIA-type phosphatase [Cyanobium sp. T1B-Tous]|jgi:HAD superfamily phosphatase (TIGR01668 family)|uniref:YqeG family HAD IIIA-type phosphatase n=1 Tax=Cyanobium sp. T1B-Tous TaxID=2823721 RepID=UPI0020CD37FE|nr:YqeG family HAD IIIA-type phosphatase [Cyanobium sp. T1B-Tous]MCP9805030.1 YqeG family HAD IIIA-type phosphatase [Cyanobium sp. T1B-Tous]MCX5940082.1 YqeG family HAD IIIA-type phosphatase [Cyanobium sp. LacPavin_0818_WC50_MAG_67_9]
MLRQLLRPNWLRDCTLAELPLQELLDQPIRALVLDVDRTLLPRRQAALPDSARRWLETAQQHMPIHLFSNNPSRQRIGAVAAELNLPYTISAGKPRRSALRKVLAELKLPHEQVALIGDRLFTDVIAGNRLGLFTVLVKPIDPLGRPCQRDRLQKLELRLARWVGTTLG